jgi:Tfp pilus assembly protein PilV
MKFVMSQSMKKEWLTISRGFLLIEVILATSIFALFLTAFAGALYYGLQSSNLAGDRGRAIMVAEEGQEAIRSIKNVNFANLVDGTYGLTYSSNAWNLLGSSDMSGIFTRQVTISTVSVNRKNVVVTVSWQQTPARIGSVSTSARLTNWKTILNLGIGITVNKIVINHGLTKIASDFSPYKVGTTTVALGSSTLFSVGTYTVSETTNSNYIQTFTGDCNGSGQITVATGSAKLCTITNEEKLAYVTVNKIVINHGKTKTAANFAPYKVDQTTVTLGAQTPINSGSHTITEATDTAYLTTFSGDCFTDGTIVLASGDNKVCSLTNEEIVTGNSSQSLAGIMIYGDGTKVPKYRTFNQNTNTFSAETGTFTASVGPTWILRTSPTQHLALAGYYDSSGTLTIMCFNGTTWTQEYQAGSGGVGNRHRFDIAFEKTTGNAMVIYSKGAHVFGDLGYHTKVGGTGCGAGWSGETIFAPARTSNDIMYVKLAQDRRVGSNLLAMTWVDVSNSISAAIWSGSAWTNEPTSVTDNNLEIVSSSHDIENMAIEYESLSGDIMLVWSNAKGNNGTNGARYRTCNGGIVACSWGPVTTPPTFSDDATSLDIAANQNTDEMVFASIGKSGGDLQIGYWNGSAWTNTANVDTSCTSPYTGSKLVSVGWLTLGSTTRSIIVYSDLNSTAINWYTGNGGVFIRQPDFIASPTIASPRGYMDIHMNPRDQSQLMYLTSDGNSNLFAKRLILTGTTTFTWTNSDGGALEKTLPQIISSPFSFAFWQQ